MGGLYTTPKDIAQALKKHGFQPDHSAEAHPSEPTVWEPPRQVRQKSKTQVSVEVDERKGTWTVYSGETRQQGRGGAQLDKALSGVNEAGAAPYHRTPKDIAHILTKLQLRRRPDQDSGGGESWVDQKGRGNVEVSVSESGRWSINYEGRSDIGYGLGQLAKKLIGVIAQKQQKNEGLTAEELDELTGTGGVGGFGTPYAFAGNDEDKKKVNEAFEALMEGTRSTSDEYEKMLKAAGYKNLGAGAGSSDEWERQYKTGTKTIFVNINGWNVNGGKQGDTAWQLKRYLDSQKGAAWQKNEALVVEGKTPPDFERFFKQHRFTKEKSFDIVDMWKYSSTEIYVTIWPGGKWEVGWGEGRAKRGTGLPNLKSALSKYIRIQGPGENVNEAGDPYYGWRNDETKTPRQKIGGAISEINRQLKEVEKVVRRTQRLKKETGTSNGALWNRTNKAMMKIESRMHRISQTIRNMRG